MVVEVDSLRTIVRNTSGKTRKFSFLPPHGRELADDEEFSIPGDLLSQITSRRAREAFEDAVAAGEIQVRQTGAPIILDDDTGEPKQLVVASGAVTGEDPILPSV